MSAGGIGEQPTYSGMTPDTNPTNKQHERDGRSDVPHQNKEIGNLDGYEPEYVGLPKTQEREAEDAKEYADVDLRPVVQPGCRVWQTTLPQYAIPTQVTGQEVLEASTRRNTGNTEAV